MEASLIYVMIGPQRYRPALPAALRVRSFALLFYGQAVSLFGDALFMVALPFAALELTDSPAAVGLVLAAQFVPFAAFALVGGAWADRLERRRVMLACDVLRAGVQLVAGTLLVIGAAQIWQLAALAAAYGVGDAFFSPAAVGLMPAAAGLERLHEANALLGGARNLMRLLGAPVGGVLVAAVGAGETILIDAATFVVSAGFLARMRVAAPAREHAPETTLRAIATGWREVRARPWLRSFLGVLLTYHLLVLPCVFVLGPLIAQRTLDGARSWGVIAGGFGVGALIGSLTALRWRPARPMLVCGAAFAVASCQAAFVGEGGSTLVIASLQVLSGAAVSMGFTVWETTLGHQVPEATLSRVVSFDFLSSVGSMPLGMAVVGPIAEAVGLHATMLAASAISVAIASAYSAQRAVRALR
jgi:MFS family permease